MGRVQEVSTNGGCLVVIADAAAVLGDTKCGDSISVNGICLTVTSLTADSFTVGVSPETLRRTNAGDWHVGLKVNLERAVSALTRMGGHLVQGHIDFCVVISSIVQDPPDAVIYSFSVTNDFLQMIVSKGYVALDGISLTVTAVNYKTREFSVMVSGANLADSLHSGACVFIFEKTGR